MKKKHKHISIRIFFEKNGASAQEKTMAIVSFPDFQREPTVWSLRKKQRLIDSILRDFDISSFYFYDNEKEGTLDCIDGKQRIYAILSFLGDNTLREETDNKFRFKPFNEIFEDELLKSLNGKTFDEFPQPFKDKILDYKLNIIELRDVVKAEELNLQFLRLQFASILNAGEKLHAMTGDMRDFIFSVASRHDFFSTLKVPYRRYAREQVCAQICLNVFTRRELPEKRKNADGEEIFYRCRYEDLQDFIKKYRKFTKKEQTTANHIKKNLDIIHDKFGDRLRIIRSRAIAVSVFFLIENLVEEKRDGEIKLFQKFLTELLKTLKWQIKKGVGMNREYYYLLEFQSNITQAGAEGYSIQNRHTRLIDYFSFYKDKKYIRGDDEFKKNTGDDPEQERKDIKL